MLRSLEKALEINYARAQRDKVDYINRWVQFTNVDSEAIDEQTASSTAACSLLEQSVNVVVQSAQSANDVAQSVDDVVTLDAVQSASSTAACSPPEQSVDSVLFSDDSILWKLALWDSDKHTSVYEIADFPPSGELSSSFVAVIADVSEDVSAITGFSHRSQL